jgi:arylsulfatase A-like enzyme
LYPTLGELAQLPLPPGLQGRSLMPLLKNPTAAWDRAALTQVTRGNVTTGRFMGYSVRTEKWRYIEWDEGKRGLQLYNESDDPDELRNLAEDPKHENVVAEMRQLLRTMRGK